MKKLYRQIRLKLPQTFVSLEESVETVLTSKPETKGLLPSKYCGSVVKCRLLANTLRKAYKFLTDINNRSKIPVYES